MEDNTILPGADQATENKTENTPKLPADSAPVLPKNR